MPKKHAFISQAEMEAAFGSAESLKGEYFDDFLRQVKELRHLAENTMPTMRGPVFSKHATSGQAEKELLDFILADLEKNHPRYKNEGFVSDSIDDLLDRFAQQKGRVSPEQIDGYERVKTELYQASTHSSVLQTHQGKFISNVKLSYQHDVLSALSEMPGPPSQHFGKLYLILRYTRDNRANKTPTPSDEFYEDRITFILDQFKEALKNEGPLKLPRNPSRQDKLKQKSRAQRIVKEKLQAIAEKSYLPMPAEFIGSSFTEELAGQGNDAAAPSSAKMAAEFLARKVPDNIAIIMKGDAATDGATYREFIEYLSTQIENEGVKAQHWYTVTVSEHRIDSHPHVMLEHKEVFGFATALKAAAGLFDDIAQRNKSRIAHQDNTIQGQIFHLPDLFKQAAEILDTRKENAQEFLNKTESTPQAFETAAHLLDPVKPNLKMAPGELKSQLELQKRESIALRIFANQVANEIEGMGNNLIAAIKRDYKKIEKS